MQLRVARLCLDCEELHAEGRCPKCISEHYAMLTTWLPVEERRKFRRSSLAAVPRRRGVLGLIDGVTRWIRGGEVIDAPSGWATRRDDHVGLDDRRDRRRARSIGDAHTPQTRVPASGSD